MFEACNGVQEAGFENDSMESERLYFLGEPDEAKFNRMSSRMDTSVQVCLKLLKRDENALAYGHSEWFVR